MDIYVFNLNTEMVKSCIITLLVSYRSGTHFLGTGRDPRSIPTPGL